MTAAAHDHVRRRIANATIQTWVELRFAKAPLTFADIYFAVRERTPMVSSRTMWSNLQTWARAGFILMAERPIQFAIIESARGCIDPPPASIAPRGRICQRSPRQRLWTAMRVLKRFDLVQLRLAADVSVPRAKDFLRTMTRAGYLRIIASPSTHLSWALGARHCGPLPPAVHHLRIDGMPIMRVTDRNDGTVIDVPLRPHWPDRRRPDRRKSSETQPLAGGEG